MAEVIVFDFVDLQDQAPYLEFGGQLLADEHFTLLIQVELQSALSVPGNETFESLLELENQNLNRVPNFVLVLLLQAGQIDIYRLAQPDYEILVSRDQELVQNWRLQTQLKCLRYY